MDNFIERLREEVTDKNITDNKLWAHVELLYIGPYNAMYFTPARIDFGSDNIIRLSNYAACGSITVQNLKSSLTNLDKKIDKIEMEIHREQDGKAYDGVVYPVYTEECLSFFRMDTDTLILTNIDIEGEIKNPFVKHVIDKLIGNETQKFNYSDPNKKFSAKIGIIGKRKGGI